MARTKEEQRSYTMSRIKGRDTKPEVMLRKALWHRGINVGKTASYCLRGKNDED